MQDFIYQDIISRLDKREVINIYCLFIFNWRYIGPELNLKKNAGIDPHTAAARLLPV